MKFLLSDIRGSVTCDQYVFTDERVVDVEATFSYFTIGSKNGNLYCAIL